MNASVRRAIQILEYLAIAGRPCELGTISSDLEMNKSTVYRFLATLAQSNYVAREEGTGRYRLGARVAWLAAQFLESMDIRRLARPTLERLAEESGETIHLAVLDGHEIMYIDKIDGRQAVRMASFVGSRAPIHSTGVGKAMLAHQPEGEWERYIKQVGLEARTPHTITDPEVFEKHLRQVREQGYSIDILENEEGICCVAAPIFNHAGQAIAAISITGWNITMTEDVIEGLIPIVKRGAASVSREAGYEK